MDWFDAAIVAAMIAAFGSLIVFLVDRYLAALARRRENAAEALSEALLWIEMPYRIARRTTDDAATFDRLTSTLHHLQERHAFHRAWLQVEVPAAYVPYSELLDAIRAQCGPHLADAWNRPPVSRPSEMNLGPIYQVDVEPKINSYVKAVRGALRPMWMRGR